MEDSEMNASMEKLNALKKETAELQKKGLPYMMASVIIWGLILLVRLLVRDLRTANILTFCAACLLMPAAWNFSKLVKADIFRKTKNPVSALALLCTLNQFLYILIVMWAFDRSPQAMVMIHAMVFGAHLLPFSWIYDSKPYLVFSIVESVGALVIGSLWGGTYVAAFIFCIQIIFSSILYKDCGR